MTDKEEPKFSEEARTVLDDYFASRRKQSEIEIASEDEDGTIDGADVIRYLASTPRDANIDLEPATVAKKSGAANGSRPWSANLLAGAAGVAGATLTAIGLAAFPVGAPIATIATAVGGALVGGSVLPKILEAVMLRSSASNHAQLSRVPSDETLRVWAKVEADIRAAAARNGESPEKPIGSLLRGLEAQGGLQPQLAKEIGQLLALRNRVAHGGAVSPTDAHKFVKLGDSVRDEIAEISRPK